jgi:cytoskeletal protein RodZ
MGRAHFGAGLAVPARLIGAGRWRAVLLLLTLSFLASCSPAAPGPTAAPAPSDTSPPAATTAPAPSPTPSATSAPPTATVTASPEPSETPSPSLTPAATDTPASTETATAVPATQAATQASGDFAPQASSIWNTTQTAYTTNGGCGSSLLPPYGLVEIAPTSGGLMWNDQAPGEYVLARVSDNNYAYSGQSATGDGNLSLALNFLSATSLTMTRNFVPANEAGCTHTHTYSGIFQWFR